jgi:hypothetical protein
LIIGQIVVFGNRETQAHYLSIKNFLEKLAENPDTTHPDFYWLSPDAYIQHDEPNE